MNDSLKFIAKKNKLEAECVSGGLHKITNNIFIPGAYDNIATKYKKGCIIWIKVNDTTFNVYKLEKETTEEELLFALSSLKK